MLYTKKYRLHLLIHAQGLTPSSNGISTWTGSVQRSKWTDSVQSLRSVLVLLFYPGWKFSFQPAHIEAKRKEFIFSQKHHMLRVSVRYWRGTCRKASPQSHLVVFQIATTSHKLSSYNQSSTSQHPLLWFQTTTTFLGSATTTFPLDLVHEATNA